MKIINKTKWSTSDLKKLARRSIKEVAIIHSLFPKKYLSNVTIEFVTGNYSGVGCYNRYWMRVRIPTPTKNHYDDDYKRTADGKIIPGTYRRFVRETERIELNSRKIAYIIMHEAMHNFGHHHNSKSSLTHHQWKRYNTADYDWAEKYPIGLKEVKQKQTRKLKQERYEHSKMMLEKKLREQKRLQNSIKKWKRKIKYYERTLVAAHGTDSATNQKNR